MILADFNNLVFSTILIGTGGPNVELNEKTIRENVVRQFVRHQAKYKKEYGDLVICCDGKDYWRRKKFPYYKAKRKERREASNVDWPLVFRSLDKIRQEFREHFPYKTVWVDVAEADDIISVLARSSKEPTLILSSDRDFVQLQYRPYLKQYDPINDKWVSAPNIGMYLKEHLIRGDSGDGIPNILSPDDVFVSGGRQKPLTSKKLETYLDQDPEDFCDEAMLTKYRRNEALIDLNKIPEEVAVAIKQDFEMQKTKKTKPMFDYFVKNGLGKVIFDMS